MSENENNVGATLSGGWKMIYRLKRFTAEQLDGRWILLRVVPAGAERFFVAVRFDKSSHEFYDFQQTPIDPNFAHSYKLL